MDFSRLPLDELERNRRKGFVGLHFQQGVPILDRDLNLLQDLVAATVRTIVENYIGNGVRDGSSGFQISARDGVENDFVVGRGSCLVGGVEVTNDADLRYSQQLGPLDLRPAPAGVSAREDLVYLDVFLATVYADPDPELDLENRGDVGVQTSVRLRPAWTVQVLEGVEPGSTTPPPPDRGHARYALARLTRTAKAAIDHTMITDLRQTVNLDAVERRLRIAEHRAVLPEITSLNPSENVVLTPDQSITINGRNLDFAPVTVGFVKVGSQGEEEPLEATSPSISSSSQIKAKVPTAAQGAKFLRVTVTTAGGSDDAPKLLKVRPATNAIDTPPAVDATPVAGPSPPAFDDDRPFTPRRGEVNDVITLNGRNFNGATAVLFGDVSSLPTTVDAAVITVAVPTQATKGKHPLTVKSPAGQATSSAEFVVDVAE